MAEDTALQDRIGKVFAETMNVEVPGGDADLLATGALDSLGLVELLARLEREFGIQISTDDIEIENFRCIQKIAEFIASRRAAIAG